ncbi:hypothetical protein MMC10_009014, partial [Thelotrema lepadinum]|nr:hypothetical protein [Thelotrema lepadinum]
MAAVRQRLIQRAELRTTSKEKFIMRVDDQFELFLTVLSSPYMVFESERDRIATMLGIQLIGNTSNRFKAVFAVRYQDIRVAVMRDPEINNEEVLIVHFTFRDTKSYLGEKDSNTISLMSYRKERCLLLCLHMTILGLALGDGAFVNDLTPSSIYHLKKKSFLEKPIFGTLTADSFRRRLQKAGEIIGLDIKVNPYTGRRGAAEAFDNSSFISEAKRNKLMQH